LIASVDKWELLRYNINVKSKEGKKQKTGGKNETEKRNKA
jgi:hypothetical protein